MGDRLLSGLRDLRARQAEIRVTDSTRAHVFVMPVRQRKTDRGRWSSRGAWEPMDRNTVSRDWPKAALEDAGLRDMPLHALRHTAAAAWLLSGQRWCSSSGSSGTARSRSPERYYGHLEQTFQRTAAHEAEAAIWGLRPLRRHTAPAALQPPLDLLAVETQRPAWPKATLGMRPALAAS